MPVELPDAFIVYDTEYTTWEGAMDRGWSGPDEHRELVQIGALRVVGPVRDRLAGGAATVAEGRPASNGIHRELEIKDTYEAFVKPEINPELSDYFIELTGITQQEVDEKGQSARVIISEFAEWANNFPLYSYGLGDQVAIEENCELLGISSPFHTSQFYDIRDTFKAHDIPADEYQSGTILTAFGQELPRRGHNALNDAKSIVEALQLLQERD